MIVTHTSPDWDAIGAVWLLKRYGGLEDCEVAFVNTGNPDPTVLAAARAVVDTGREYDPARLRFDHHQFPGQEANDDSATLLVWADVVNGRGMPWLEDIALLIFAGDTGKPDFGADWSRHIGIHALLSARKARGESDAALMEWGFSVLDDLAAHLNMRHEARATLKAHTVYCSSDGLVRGLQGAPQGATFAAYEDGARLVIFHSESPTTVSVGVMRGGESQEPHAGELIQRIIASEGAVPQDIVNELRTWYNHSAGFFSGRGTAKAPDPRPLSCNVRDIAEWIDKIWKRQM
jgi:hypothetical protein